MACVAAQLAFNEQRGRRDRHRLSACRRSEQSFAETQKLLMLIFGTGIPMKNPIRQKARRAQV
jgi:hypothetical protein